MDNIQYSHDLQIKFDRNFQVCIKQASPTLGHVEKIHP